MLGVSQAFAGGVLDAPALTRWRPLNFRPHLSVDQQVKSFGIDAVSLDYAVASFVRHCMFLPSPTPFETSNRRNAGGCKTTWRFETSKRKCR
jgi:hypothetical protein